MDRSHAVPHSACYTDKSIEEPSGISRVLRHALIVPAVHRRVLDDGFQREMYELFHRKAVCRIGHAVCTPVIMLGLFLLGVSAGRAPLDASLALSLLLAAWYLASERVVGGIMVALILVLQVAARLLAGALGPSAHAAALGLVVTGVLLQTWSHAIEDVPPPVSGADGWVPIGTWIRRLRPARFAYVVLLSSFAPLLELWGTPRVWPLQVLHLLMRAGYRPELKERIDARVAEIVANPTCGWQDPRSAR